MNFPIYLILALLPSTIWLLFYLRKDAHPEPKRMVLKIFFYGILAAFPAALIEIGIFQGLAKLNTISIFISVLYWFLGVALVEEFLKYLVIRGKVTSDPEFDEPLDIMLYMIIAALGFAAVENVLILFSMKPFQLFEAFLVTGFRFLGATFLHTLCSGVVGYFLALSFFETKRRSQLLITGLGIAMLLHGLYNFSIIETEGVLRILIPVIILTSLAFAVSLGFKKLQKMASVCKVK